MRRGDRFSHVQSVKKSVNYHRYLAFTRLCRPRETLEVLKPILAGLPHAFDSSTSLTAVHIALLVPVAYGTYCISPIHLASQPERPWTKNHRHNTMEDLQRGDQFLTCRPQRIPLTSRATLPFHLPVYASRSLRSEPAPHRTTTHILIHRIV